MKTQYSLVSYITTSISEFTSFYYAVKDRLKAVPVDEFGEHVQRMHADRDKWFELEYNVS